MKFGTIKSIGHNVADSLSCGIGLLVGYYEMDVYGEAAASPEGYVEVDFLAGTSRGGRVSGYLADAIRAYAEALPDFCKKHGASASDFKVLTARFSGTGLLASFTVTVEDRNGRRSTDVYVGRPGTRRRVLDSLGRIRRK